MSCLGVRGRMIFLCLKAASREVISDNCELSGGCGRMKSNVYLRLRAARREVISDNCELSGLMWLYEKVVCPDFDALR